MRKTKAEAEVFERYLEDYKARKINREVISKKFNMIYHEINNYLYRRGIPVWDTKVRRESKYQDKITKYIKMYSDKKITRKQIAQELGVTISTVYSWLRRRGVEIWDSEFKTVETVLPSGSKIISRVKKKEKEEWRFTPFTKEQIKTNFKNYADMIYSYNK